MMATGEDFRVPTTRGERPAGHRLNLSYLDRVFAVGGEDAKVMADLARVMSLTASPGTLFAPRTIWKALSSGPLGDVMGPFATPSLGSVSTASDDAAGRGQERHQAVRDGAAP